MFFLACSGFPLAFFFLCFVESFRLRQYGGERSRLKLLSYLGQAHVEKGKQNSLKHVASDVTHLIIIISLLLELF